MKKLNLLYQCPSDGDPVQDDDDEPIPQGPDVK